MEIEVQEFATIKDVPILKAGTHRSRNAGDVVIEESDIDEYIEGSTVLKELIREAMSTGEYKGNPHIKKGFVPGPLNLHHNDFLDETLKLRTKDVNWTYGKKKIGDDIWLTETLENVPSDVAKALKTEYPFRSVEILPNMVDPNTGKKYKGVLRSTAFLNRFTPPAVRGQTPDLVVEFSEGESPVMTLFSSVQTTQQQPEVQDMADKQDQAVMPDTGKDEKISELTGKLSEKDSKIAELQAEKDKEAAELAELRKERDANAAAIAELQAAREKADVREFMGGFKSQILQGEHEEKVQLSPAFAGIVQELIEGAGKGGVIMLAEGERPAREVLQAKMQEIAELAAKGGIVVCLSELGKASHQEPDAKPATTQERVKQLMAENDGMSHLDAWKLAEKEKEVA